jgi:DNA-binding Lrp family transcriptional regulator
MDKIDKKILILLEKNSKLPTKKLAKECRISREVASYRIKKLQEKKIIKKYIAKLNQEIFTSGGANISIKLNWINEKRRNEIEKFFTEQKHINWFAILAGRYDYTLTIFYKDTSDLGNAIDEINSYLGKDLLSNSFSLYLKEYKFQRTPILESNINNNSYNNKSEKNQEIRFEKTKINNYKFDNNDIKILRELSINSNQTYIQIANKINLNDETVRQKIKKLEKNNIILGYTIVIDAYKCGYEGYHILINLDNYTLELENKIKKEIISNPHVYFSAKMSGNYNIVFGIYSKDREHFKSILEEIKKILNKNIKEINIELQLNEKKEIYVPEYFIINNT